MRKQLDEGLCMTFELFEGRAAEKCTKLWTDDDQKSYFTMEHLKRGVSIRLRQSLEIPRCSSLLLTL